MYCVNKTNSEIVLAGVLAGNDLVVPANGKSTEFVPNPELLRKAIINQDDLEFHVTSGSQIEAVHEMDNRFDTILILD